MRWTGVGAAIIATAIDALYLGVVGSQGASDPQFLRVPFVALFIALAATCAALSSLGSAVRWRSLLLGYSAAGLLLIGFLAIFSIGLPLIVAGLLAVGGLVGTLSRAGSPRAAGGAAGGIAAAGAALAVVVLVAGSSFTELAIRCPTNGVEGGSGADFLSGSYQYTCYNGELTVSR